MGSGYRREITIHDLLTKQAGMGYPPRYLAATYAPLDLQTFYFAHKMEPMRVVIDQLAKVPFRSQPGEKYENGFATDVLGVVIENVSGMSLDKLFQTRIFDPLKMPDTSFYLPKEKVAGSRRYMRRSRVAGSHALMVRASRDRATIWTARESRSLREAACCRRAATTCGWCSCS